MTLLERLRASIPEGRALELVKAMVAIPSYNPPGNEMSMAKFVNDVMHKAGCQSALQQTESGRFNVIARLPGNGLGGTIIFNTHMDVVPAGEGWVTDPLAVSMREERIYGRGVMDAKGSLASMMAAIEALARSGHKFEHDIVLAAVADEEGASIGAHSLPDFIDAKFAVVGESTNGDIALSHRGSLRPVLVAEGITAHSARPELGVNAINLMARVLTALETYAKEVVAKRVHPYSGQSTLTVTVIQGGLKESMVPDRCEAVIDRRLIPGENKQSALDEMMAVIDQVPGAKGHVRIDRFIPTTGDASEIDSRHSVVSLLAQAIHHVYGREPEYTGLTCNCDMSYFMGQGIPTAIYGPGDFAAAHMANEWIELSELEKATWVYAAIVLQSEGKLEITEGD
ncbi:MAG: M20 family metallopeptidase [Sporolactobacillus sp.]